MATSSITHNFVIDDKKGSAVLEKVLDEKPLSRTKSVKAETISSADNVKAFIAKIDNGKKI